MRFSGLILRAILGVIWTIIWALLGKFIGTIFRAIFFPPALQMCSYASSFLPERVLSYCVKNHIHKAATHRAYFRVCSRYVYGVEE